MSTTAVSKPEAKKDIRNFIQSDTVKAQLAMVLPKHLTPDRMARVVTTAILKTPKLLDCKPESLLQAMMICSQAGLEPDGRNAHLIPYGDIVQVIFDYKGLVAMAERNGVECIYADRVCENDEFEAWVEEGEKKLKHRVNWKGDRGPAYAYYASCRRNNRLDYEVMTKADVDAIRKRSKASSSGPWMTDYDEMAKKTVLRRMSKRWDLSPEVAEAINADADSPEFGKPSAPSFDRKAAENLLGNAPVEKKKKDGAAKTPPVPEPPLEVSIESLKMLMERDGIEESDLLVAMLERKMIDDSLSSLDEVLLVAPAAIKQAVTDWEQVRDQAEQIADAK